jgi:hypothetical protein
LAQAEVKQIYKNAELTRRQLDLAMEARKKIEKINELRELIN